MPKSDHATLAQSARLKLFCRVVEAWQDYVAEGSLRVATDKEREQLWERMMQVYPRCHEYQKKTKREIPVVVLEKQPAWR